MLCRKLIFITILSFPVLVQAQYIEQAEAKADLEMLSQSIKIYNPALEHYNPDFNTQARQVIEQVGNDSISLFNHFSYISRLCALSNEGHFSLGTWQDTVHSGFLQNRYKYLPVSIKVLSGKMYVWHDYSNEQSLNRGNEILAINNRPSREIIGQLRAAMPTDGDITTYTDHKISLGFSWLYYLHIEQAERFTIITRDSNGETASNNCLAINRQQQGINYRQYCQPKDAAVAEETSFHELSFTDDFAYLKLSSFDHSRAEKYKVKAKSLYKSIFKEIKHHEKSHLIIDLRANTGGLNEFADEMVRFIATQKPNVPYLKKTISWTGKERVYKAPKPSKHAFKGKIYVLVDGMTFSSASTLARYLKEFADAIIIGEETGTRYEGFAAGSKQSITLPHSGIMIAIPRYHIFFPESSKQTTSNRGLLPDIAINYTIENLISGTDLHLLSVRQLIAQE